MAQKVKVKRNKSRIIKLVTTIAALVFLCYAAIYIAMNIKEAKDLEKQIGMLKEEQIAQQDANDELRRLLEAENPAEYVEKVARDKLNYVYPDEQVYYVIPED